MAAEALLSYAKRLYRLLSSMKLDMAAGMAFDSRCF